MAPTSTGRAAEEGKGGEASAEKEPTVEDLLNELEQGPLLAAGSMMVEAPEAPASADETQEGPAREEPGPVPSGGGPQLGQLGTEEDLPDIELDRPVWPFPDAPSLSLAMVSVEQPVQRGAARGAVHLPGGGRTYGGGGAVLLRGGGPVRTGVSRPRVM